MRFDVNRILESILIDLPERSRDVVISRFGIGKRESETLEAIGQRYSITRERVRQIEADSLKSIRARRDRGDFAVLLRTLEEFVEEHGDVVDEHTARRQFSREYFDVTEPREWEGMVALGFAVGERLKKASASDIFTVRWFVDQTSLSAQEDLCRKIIEYLKKRDEILSQEELSAYAKSLNPSLSSAAILSYVAGCTVIKSNVFNQWGLKDWPEIRPRGVRDKAHLVMKQHGKPLHFTDVALLINESGFGGRPALAQTVHNELIKDQRFVLVGRGLYALRDWGYEPGTVKDVIEDELKKQGPLAKDELVRAVLARRHVKPSTVVLNLNQFKKTSDGKYTIA
jgi:hypothetical protein